MGSIENTHLSVCVCVCIISPRLGISDRPCEDILLDHVCVFCFFLWVTEVKVQVIEVSIALNN